MHLCRASLEDDASAKAKIREVGSKLKALCLAEAAELVIAKGHETLTYLAFPE